MPEAGEYGVAHERPPAWLLRLAAAVETAVPSAMAVVVWFSIHSRLMQEPWWSKFNVAAAPYFGDRVYYMGFGRASLAGVATLFALYSMLGILFAFLAGGRGPWRALLTSLLWLTAWHFFALHVVWPKLDPFAAPYFPLSATAPAHAAAAILLSRLPRVHGRLQRLGSPRTPAPSAAPPPQCAPPSGAAAQDEVRRESPAASEAPPASGPDW